MKIFNTKSGRRRLRLLQMLALCAFGVLVNVVGSYIARTFEWKVYLDSIGTVWVAVFGGYVPGVFTGILTNLTTGLLIDSTSVYYASLNVMIAIIAAYMARKHLLRRPLGIVVCILALSAVGGVLGSIISWCINGEIKEGIAGSADSGIFTAAYWKVFFRNMFTDFYRDLFDKTITVLVTVIPYNYMPKRFRRNLRFRGWQQRALSHAEKDELVNIQTRSISLRTKIVMLLVITSLMISVVATAISVSIYRNNAVDEKTRLAQETAALAAAVIDGDQVKDILERGRKAKDYNHMENLLYEIKSTSPDIEYVYVYQITEKGCRVLFDLDAGDVPGEEPLTMTAFDVSFEDRLPDLLAGREIDPILSNDVFGWLLTVYHPVYDSNGKCVCYAGVDISMKQLTANNLIFLTKMISLFLGFLLIFLVLGWWFAEYNITLPINTMARSADSFAYNTDEEVGESVERFKELDIHTGDEIENLYQILLKMSEDSVQHLEDLRKKNETISQMQSALIMVLADMVENRDEDTGDHIRKTAAYTKIIMEGMRKKGYYSEQLTDTFVDDVFHSAPLHDIGKIKVPDAILNKPGKLTDEEFAEMKKHTLAGEAILDKVIATVPESGYLTEARNLATYHHEKWNGKGYPRGLSGENIPLSARIMAVADVFDALVSKRVYKPAFPIDKALSIIREDSGSHFDPLVADAFLSEEEEVRKVAEAFGSEVDKLLG